MVRNRPKEAEAYARQLLRGDRIMLWSNHHAGVAVLLGPRPEGMEVSRTCANDCPDSWFGYAPKGSAGHWTRVPYRLCIPSHYVYESRADNMRRRYPLAVRRYA